ncbi:hypothetical protein EDC01DRAFT_630748 [Geopyxis carbonaria]|nr:hypothetical protein EDC01DRAFT_630748 [Geopyxis carbonaria]
MARLTPGRKSFSLILASFIKHRKITVTNIAQDQDQDHSENIPSRPNCNTTHPAYSKYRTETDTMMTRSKTYAKRMNDLAKQIANAEAHLKNLKEQITHTDQELADKAERIEQQDHEIENKEKRLVQLDEDIQKVLDIGHIEEEDKNKQRHKKKIIFDDGESITDLSEFEYIWEAMGWKVV